MINNAGLYGKQTQATNGTKFRTNNNHNPTTLKEKIANIDKQITQHLTKNKKSQQGVLRHSEG